MAVQGFTPKKAESTGEYVSAVLPEDSYQCVIERVELREGTKYMSTETEMQLLFYIRPLEVDPEFKGKLLFYQTTTSFFNGKSDRARSNVKASKLYNMVKTVYKHYFPKEKVEEWTPEQVTDEVINSLEGKQIIAIVKETDTGKNKVADIMSIKAEITSGDAKGKTPDEELDELLETK